MDVVGVFKTYPTYLLHLLDASTVDGGNNDKQYRTVDGYIIMPSQNLRAIEYQPGEKRHNRGYSIG